MYGMFFLENYKTYDRNFFTNRQRLFDFVLFSHEMHKETRIVGFIQRAPICMVSLLENYKRYDRNFFTNRQRMFDYILFSPEMVEETRVICLASTPYFSI